MIGFCVKASSDIFRHKYYRIFSPYNQIENKYQREKGKERTDRLSTPPSIVRWCLFANAKNLVEFHRMDWQRSKEREEKEEKEKAKRTMRVKRRKRRNKSMKQRGRRRQQSLVSRLIPLPLPILWRSCTLPEAVRRCFRPPVVCARRSQRRRSNQDRERK